MTRARLTALCFGIILCGPIIGALAQNLPGGGTGGKLPQDLDTLSLSLTAGTTQTQAGATLCTSTICYVGTVGTGNDGLKIRQCTQAPMRVTVVNGSATNAMQVYGSGTDTINGVATGTGISVPAYTSTPGVGAMEFICVSGGTAAKWFTISH